MYVRLDSYVNNILERFSSHSRKLAEKVIPNDQAPAKSQLLKKNNSLWPRRGLVNEQAIKTGPVMFSTPVSMIVYRKYCCVLPMALSGNA